MELGIVKVPSSSPTLAHMMSRNSETSLSWDVLIAYVYYIILKSFLILYQFFIIFPYVAFFNSRELTFADYKFINILWE